MTEAKKDFENVIETTLRDAIKMKNVMLAKKLTQARALCPECEGELHGALVGRKNHMRFWCDGPCKRQIME